MSDARENEALAEIAASLRRNASGLWAPERADALEPVIEETSRSTWQIPHAPTTKRAYTQPEKGCQCRNGAPIQRQAVELAVEPVHCRGKGLSRDPRNGQ